MREHVELPVFHSTELVATAVSFIAQASVRAVSQLL